MFKLVAVLLVPLMACASDLPSKKYVNLAAVKTWWPLPKRKQKN